MIMLMEKEKEKAPSKRLKEKIHACISSFQKLGTAVKEALKQGREEGFTDKEIVIREEMLSLSSSNPQCPEKCVPVNSYDKAKQDINGICECIGCDANATSRVLVKVGDNDQITLFLCEKCRPQLSPSSK
jgi:hypothetical protein